MTRSRPGTGSDDSETGEEAALPRRERRAHPRHRVSLPATFYRQDGREVATEVVDISAGGLRLAGGGAGLREGARGAVAVRGLFAPLPCTVMGTEHGALRLRFDAIQILREELVERLSRPSWNPRHS